jgi:hypothetical protein
VKGQIKIIGYQAVLVILAAIVGYVFYPERLGLLGALFGGSISVITSIVMVGRLNQAAKKSLQGSQRGNLYIYLGAIERLCIAIVLFGLGFMWFKLTPLPMLVGLMAGQIGFAIGGFKTKD